MGERALVVEDEESIAQLNGRLLELEGFRVDIALTAFEGGRLARTNDYTMVILDMNLPDGRGIDVLQIIRERSRTTPVLIVSGVDKTGITVNALDAGADDYLHKPYHTAELRARVRALVRRGQLVESPRIECGNVMLHRMERYATVADEPLNLTGKEFALLEYFVINRGKALARKDLLEKVWRFDFDPGTNMVDVNVARLRAKLAALGANCLLQSQRGVGYVFSESDSSAFTSKISYPGLREPVLQEPAE
jgi:DNA-binding response OmpR family regulator